MLLSLYSGCGGLDLGFEQAGFSIGLAYDIDDYAIASWNRNRQGRRRGYVADITSLEILEMDSHFGGQFNASAVIGGPPCQSFSRANVLRSDRDSRSELVKTFFSMALKMHASRRKLDFILMENVPELAQARDGTLLKDEVTRLEENDFQVQNFLLYAADFGVPQYRRRLFVLAVANHHIKQSGRLPPTASDGKVSVKQAIGGLPEPVRFKKGLQEDSIPHHPNHWCMKPKSNRFFDGSLKAGDTSGRSFKTLAWNDPSVTASYGNREVHVHPQGHRRLSVFEAMKIQGFPNTYVLEGTLSSQIDQVSEAVPPPLAYSLATSIMHYLDYSDRDSDGSIPFCRSNSSNALSS